MLTYEGVIFGVIPPAICPNQRSKIVFFYMTLEILTERSPFLKYFSCVNHESMHAQKETNDTPHSYDREVINNHSHELFQFKVGQHFPL